MYQADVGRWFVVDSLAEIYRSYTSYQYVRNSPINALDPNGTYDVFINGKKVPNNLRDDAQRLFNLPDETNNDSNGEEDNNDGDSEKEQAEEEIYFEKLLGPVSFGVSVTEQVVGGSKELLVKSSYPVYDQNGNLIAFFKTYEKLPFRAFKIVNGAVKGIGWGLNLISVIDNTQKVVDNEIGVKRYIYRMGGTISATGSTLAIGGSAGGPVGLVVGGLFILGELSYDSIQELNKHTEWSYKNTHHRNRIDDWKDFKNDISWWMNIKQWIK